MDTKGLKPHKRPKKIKSSSKKGNADVLVVPPDILKKLGISIGNSSSSSQVPSPRTIPPRTEIDNRDLIANNLTSKYCKESDESSILETANLMKKSVFLSPTFVPTVANVISGEVEISNSKSFVVDPVVLSTASVGSTRVISEIDGAHDVSQENGEIDVNCDLTINGVFTSIPHINGDITEVSPNQSLISAHSILNNSSVKDHNGCMGEKISQSPNNRYLDNSTKCDITSNRINTANSTNDTALSTFSIEGEGNILIEQIDVSGTVHSLDIQEKNGAMPLCSLISLEGNAIQTNMLEKSLVYSDCSQIVEQSANDLICVKSSQSNAIHKDNIEPDTNYNSSEESEVLIEEIEVLNNFISTERDVIKVPQTEAEYSYSEQSQIAIIQIVDEKYQESLDKSKTQVEDSFSENKKDYLKESESSLQFKQLSENLNALKESIIQLKHTQNEHSTVEHSITHVQQNETYPIPLEGSDNLIKISKADNDAGSQVGNEINTTQNNLGLHSIEANTIPIKQTDTDIHSTPSEGCANQVMQVEGTTTILSDNVETGNNTKELQDVKSIEPNVIWVQPADNNINDLQPNSTSSGSGIEGYLGGLLTQNRQVEFANIETKSDIEEDETVTSFSNGYKVEDGPQKMNEDIIVHVQDDTVIPTVDNNDNSNQALKDNYLEDSLNQKYHLGFEQITSNVSTVPVNKSIHKINIISEEIIPPSSFRDLSRAQSTVKQALTPVPLNTIILSKKINDTTRFCETTLGSKNCSLEFPNSDSIRDLETNDKHKAIREGNISNQNYIYTNTLPGKVDATSNESSLKNNKDDVTYEYAAIECENSINNNGVVYIKVIEDAVTGITENSNNIESSKSENIGANVKNKCNEKRDLTEVHLSHESTMQEGAVQNGQCNTQELEIHNAESECVNNQHFRDECVKEVKINKDAKAVSNKVAPKMKLAKKKKTINADDRSKNESTGPAVKAFSDVHLNNILKSNQDSSGTNSHLDKVKEIAEYIKKFAHLYKESKKEVNKDANKTANKKETINSKSNLIKSKLCIQGVEKPGGKKTDEEIHSNINTIKTYSRQKKQGKPCLPVHISDNIQNVTSNIVGSSHADLNTADITSINKKQDFCLCYDFGRLDVYDNAYEHIHFCLHNDSTDLESILGIYNDSDIIYKDRTELDDSIILNISEDETAISNICWNYFASEDRHGECEDIEPFHEELPMDHCVEDKLKHTEITESALGHNITNSICNDKIESCKASKNSYNIITIVEMEDDQNKNNDASAAGSDPTNVVELISDEEESVDIAQTNTGDGKREATNVEAKKTPKKNEISFGASSAKKNVRKRTLSDTGSQDRDQYLDVSGEEPPPQKKAVKCGVCHKILSIKKWERHMSNSHSYIAWKEGEFESFNLDDPKLINNLHQRLESHGTLKCPICLSQTKKFHKFITHIKGCLNIKEPTSRRTSLSKDIVTCGVCDQNVQYMSWMEHIGQKHQYLAWIKGQPTLDLDDETALVNHLQKVIRANSCLTCYKCGLSRKRAKLFLSHIETCDGEAEATEADTTMELVEEVDPIVVDKKSITCGVCKQEVHVRKWTEHIGKEHNYLAWKDGQSPLDLDDEEAVWDHLQDFIRNNGGLLCYKCGLNRKRVKLYLSHIKTCEGFNQEQSDTEDVSMDQGDDDKKYECGVCHTRVSVSEWNEHIGKEHNYLAWKVGSTPLDLNDDDAVKEHLLNIVRTCEGLICYKCGLLRRRVNLYQAHVRTCDGSGESRLNESTSSGHLNFSLKNVKVEVTIDNTENIVKCGVCEEDVAEPMWIEHIGREHTYIAWQKGKVPLDVTNEAAVKEYLLVISREHNGLKCNKCGVIKKYPKSFQNHIKECTGSRNVNDSLLEDEAGPRPFDVTEVTDKTVICGVCNNEVQTAEWYEHMGVEHEYKAWLADRPTPDLSDNVMIMKHLLEVSRLVGGLKCNKCGIIRKYPKCYLSHIEICGNEGSHINRLDAAIVGNEPVECAVCFEKMNPRDWHSHAMSKHYNVAWIVGATPIEINNPYGVEPYIKEYQQRHKLSCKKCGITRVSAVGFYAHIIVCGKTEEETDIYKNVCEICNNKYLRIYKSQHMTMHREKEYAQERKMLLAKEKAIKEEENAGIPVEIVGGRRKAAEKAKTVIEKYTSNKTDGPYCSKCGFSSEIEAEMANHVCVEVKYEFSDSDESVELDHVSDDDEEDSDIDSNISDEEREALDQLQTKSKKHGDSGTSKIQRLPYPIKNLNSYMRKSAEEFIDLHLTDKDIFPQWRNLEYEVVAETEINNYLPPLEESCKVRYDATEDWITYKRFEATKPRDVITLFTGACIQCMRWVPPYVGEISSPAKEFLSIVTHLDSDIPRHLWHEKPSHSPALVQIWDCGSLISTAPEFVMGLALDCGVIWALDWCPSGARDIIDPDKEMYATLRLGLIAVASATGSAYIYAVPHPSMIKEKDQKFIKLKPIVEMRLAMSSNRRVYQATSIKWSSQKGHTHVVVGYSDGTLAYYDLKNESPLLKATENDLTVFYPYHDERVQNMCIEDVDAFPARNASVGAVVAGSVGGAGARGAGAALQAHAAAARVLFPPHWPAALLAGDDNLVSQAVNELEWYGGGRRVGGMRACGGCAWCARACAAAAPLVRLMRPHPAYCELHRQVIATIHMVPFGKRKRKNDELSMIMEPLTYNDAIGKYGIEFKQIVAKDKNTQQRLSGLPREAYPERFPLADISAMVFCPSATNHHKLAIATHAGFVFIMNV